MNPFLRCIIPISFGILPFVCSAQRGQTGGAKKTKTAASTAKASPAPVKEEPIHEFPDQNPDFPYLYQYMAENIIYPQKAMDEGKEGRVLAEFVVEKDGCLSHLKIKTSVSEECDAEVIRMLKDMPAWNPGTIEGEPVRVRYEVVINFRRQPNSTPPAEREKHE